MTPVYGTEPARVLESGLHGARDPRRGSLSRCAHHVCCAYGRMSPRVLTCHVPPCVCRAVREYTEMGQVGACTYVPAACVHPCAQNPGSVCMHTRATYVSTSRP